MRACLRSPIGSLVGRPWFDRAAMHLLRNWFFPLSRLWAAARAADGSLERFLAAMPGASGVHGQSLLARRLRRFEGVRGLALDSERAWEAAFFGDGDVAPDGLAGIERQRLFRRNGYNAQRRLFVPWRSAVRSAPIRWAIPSPEEVAADYASLVADPAQAFAVPDPMPPVAESRRFPAAPGRRDRWIRFASPSSRMNDAVVARVYEPDGIADPPTLIFGHGICVEFDHWRGLVDEIEALVAMGIRVVRPEAPWHGRRVPDGRYGGEMFIASAPRGALDHFTAAAREWAVLIDWCRRTSDAPVAIGGSSLGAMTSQVVVDKARFWPERLQPDAMLLITHTGRIADAAVHGSMAQAWGIAENTMARGWTSEQIGRFMPLLDPVGEPVIAPGNIVTVLGSRDDVTPFASARLLIEEWRVPPENRFIWRRGHFSVPVAMLRNRAPLRRFKAVLDGIG